MALFDKLARGAGKAVDQAKFEAEKLRKVTALNSEVSKLKDQLNEATVAIGAKVLELKETGVDVPELKPLIEAADGLRDQLAAKEAELEAVRATEYEHEEEAEKAPQEKAEPAEAKAGFCPNCGAALSEGAKFCPGCGAKLG